MSTFILGAALPSTTAHYLGIILITLSTLINRACGPCLVFHNGKVKFDELSNAPQDHLTFFAYIDSFNRSMCSSDLIVALACLNVRNSSTAYNACANEIYTRNIRMILIFRELQVGDYGCDCDEVSFPWTTNTLPHPFY